MSATLSSSVMKEHKVLISASVLKMGVKVLNMVQHLLKMDTDVPPFGDPVTLQAVANEWMSSNKMCQNDVFFLTDWVIN